MSRLLCVAVSLLALLACASPASARPTLRVAPAADMGRYLDEVFALVRAPWREAFLRSGRSAPGIKARWPTDGERIATRCRRTAGPWSSFYCPRDHTEYIGQVLAVRVWNGLRGPGGEAYGDFGVATVVAHEYGHGVEQRLGLLRRRRATVERLELMADCLSGLWARWAWGEHLLDPGDTNEAVATLQAFGDYEAGAHDSHGRPGQRRAAWLRGFAGASVTRCSSLVRARPR